MSWPLPVSRLAHSSPDGGACAMVRNPRRSLRRAGAVRGAFAVAAATLGFALLHPIAPAVAQTSALDVRIVTGQSTRITGGLITGISVVNTGSDALTNVQVVVRVPASPAIIQSVGETVVPLGEFSVRAGVVDERTGFWYHTIASLPGGSTVSFNVNWFNPCAGRWPFAVRANDRRSSVSFTFTGPSANNCGLDDISAPTPAAWFELPWPPSSTTTTSTSTSTTVAGAVVTIPQAGASTVPGATAPSTVPGASTTVTSKPPTTKPPTTPRPSTTRRPATTLEIVCKTVGGRRYCGPKSSALKPGQAKPRAVPPTTKKKKK